MTTTVPITFSIISPDKEELLQGVINSLVRDEINSIVAIRDDIPDSEEETFSFRVTGFNKKDEESSAAAVLIGQELAVITFDPSSTKLMLFQIDS